MTKKGVRVSIGDTRDLNCTCNILHIARAAQFNTSDVLKQIVVAQGLLATGETLPPDVNAAFGGQTGVSWLGGDSSDVLACTWSKSIDSVVGTLNFQLKSAPGSPRYLDTVLPGDLLVVFMDDAGDYDPDNRFSGTLETVAIVDRVEESTAPQNMATVNNVSVSARDLAVVMAESSTVFDQAFAVIENAMFTGSYTNLLFGDKKQSALSPMENVFNLLLLLFDRMTTASVGFPKGSAMTELQWKLSPSGAEVVDTQEALDEFADLTQVVSLIDVVTHVQNPMPFYALAKPPAIIQAGNIWSLLEGYANTTLNEFFIDVRDNTSQERQFRAAQSQNAHDMYFNTPDGVKDEAEQNVSVLSVLSSKVFQSSVVQTNGDSAVPSTPDGASSVALVHRQRPYDDDAFNNLPFTLVDSTEVETLVVARSSHDVINWFRIKFPDLDVKLQEVVAGVRIIPQSIAKFGYRRMDAETIYMFTSSNASETFDKGSTKTDFGDVFRAYVALLSSWFSQNEYWLAGTMTMRFKPSIRVGTRLRLQRSGELFDFYVVGATQSFSKDPGSSRSSYTLTRGRSVSAATIPLPTFLDFQHQGFAASKPQTGPVTSSQQVDNFHQGVIPGLGG